MAAVPLLLLPLLLMVTIASASAVSTIRLAGSAAADELPAGDGGLSASPPPLPTVTTGVNGAPGGPVPGWGCVCNVKDYGDLGLPGSVDSSAAVASAIRACTDCPGGGNVILPGPGLYLTAPFNLSSHMQLTIEPRATLMASDDFGNYPLVPPLPSYGSGREFDGPDYAPFIGCWNCINVTITGGGVIDGQGAAWWAAFRQQAISNTRPRLVQFRSSTHITVANLTLQNSPFWTLHLVYSRGIRATDLVIRSPSAHDNSEAPNTDGIDPDSSSDVFISDCDISTGDDAIAIKSGWDQFGRQVGLPTENVIIQNSYLHGSQNTISIGSEMSGGVRNVTVRNVVLKDVQTALRIKSARGRGGFVTDIFYENIQIHRARQALMITDNYHEVHPNQTALPYVANIWFSNIQGTNIDLALLAVGLADDHIRGLHLRYVSLQLSGRRPASKAFVCKYIHGTWASVVPEPCPELSQISSQHRSPGSASVN